MTSSFRTTRVVTALAMATVAASWFFARTAAADSLWNRRDQSSAFLFTDNVAADVGDSLTVLITDNSTFAKTGKRALSNKTTLDGTGTIKKGGTDVLPVIDVSANGTRGFETDVNYSGTVTFADSITTSVVDKLPNGNLVIAGRSERSVAGEDVVTILTGVVRPDDIAGENTISSSRVANFHLYYERHGLDEKFTVMGWLNRIVNYIWPF